MTSAVPPEPPRSPAARVLAVWIDGRAVTGERAAPVLAAGYTHGLGAFETFMIRGGRAYALDRHLARLGRSAVILGLPAPDPVEIADVVAQAHRASGSPSAARVRVQWAGSRPAGSGEGASENPADGAGRQAQLSVVLTAAGGEGARTRPGGLDVVRSGWVRNERSPLVGAKTTSYAENLLLVRAARGRGADEALLANSRGDLCEGAFTNVFVEREPGFFVTPPASSGCLPGIMRGLVLEWASTDKSDISEESMPFEILEENSTILLSSAVRGLVPVLTLDGVQRPVSPSARRLVADVQDRLARGDDS